MIYPKVKFVFESKKELDCINLFIDKFKDDSFLPKNIKKLLQENKRKEIIKVLNSSYRKNFKNTIQKDWQKIEKDYFTLIQKITGYKWLHNEYKVILTRYIPGFCSPFNPNTNEVFVQQNIPKTIRNYIIAHEIFHSHYFNIADKKKKQKLFYTELNENCDILALLFSETKKLFPGMNEKIIQSCIKSHPRAEKYFKKLLPVWNNRKNFEDYLQKSLRVFKK